MLVTFTCSVYADITMFGNVAEQMLKMMGQSGTIPGAILAEDVPAARARLEAALAAIEEPAQQQYDEEGEPIVTVHHRALPLVELLRAAEKEEVDVTWREGT
ncbi:MAG: DUF1840 domain-containing protein [Gammaproteobacteria bacterium]|jgi:hypothetical protein